MACAGMLACCSNPNTNQGTQTPQTLQTPTGFACVILRFGGPCSAVGEGVSCWNWRVTLALSIGCWWSRAVFWDSAGIKQEHVDTRADKYLLRFESSGNHSDTCGDACLTSS